MQNLVPILFTTNSIEAQRYEVYSHQISEQYMTCEYTINKYSCLFASIELVVNKIGTKFCIYYHDLPPITN